MQPASPRVAELLNQALTFELTATNTYFLHARMLDSWGLGRLGKVFYDLSIEEMLREEERHADWFEGQLDAVQRVGLPQYLAQMVVTDLPAS